MSFNGAVTFSLRKEVLHTSRTDIRSDRFNGAVTFSLRKVENLAGEVLEQIGFNGAVTFSLRKGKIKTKVSSTLSTASMGP